MSFSRCGLQYKRENIISRDWHNHPRSKQLQCWVVGEAIKPKQSTESVEVIDQQLEDDLEQKAGLKLEMKEQKGSGVMDTVASIIVPRILEHIPKKKLGETFVSTASNLFPNSDENARPIYPGEYHAIVKLPNGKYGRANYSGPGTRIVDRLRREGGDPPRVESDKVSQAHDIRYALAPQYMKPKDAVREADEIYVKKMKAVENSGLDSKFNTRPAMRAIQAKMKAENWSLLSRDKFIDTDKAYSDRDLKLLKDNLTSLEQQGYGGRSFTGKGSVRSRRKTKISPSDEGNPKSQTTSQGNRLGYIGRRAMIGGAQAPGTQPSASSRYINVRTGNQRGGLSSQILPFSRNAYFDNQYPKKLGGDLVNNHGKYGKYQGTRHVEASQLSGGSELSQVGGRIPKKMASYFPHIGKGYPGANVIESDVPNVVPDIHLKMKGGFAYPGDKLLRKMSKKVKKKYGYGPKPIYMDERDMSSFLARKLAPMIMVH